MIIISLTQTHYSESKTDSKSLNKSGISGNVWEDFFFIRDTSPPVQEGEKLLVTMFLRAY